MAVPAADLRLPYVYVDGIYLKRSWGGSCGNVAVMVAIGVNEDGCREVIGCAEGFAESAECWRDFLSWLKSRGPRGARMFIDGKSALMLVKARAKYVADSEWGSRRYLDVSLLEEQSCRRLTE